ncbi:hypothetical protein KIH23_09885 [Flavobacterium sp. CYK-55]|uniref:hypothetical protein n=1 Tax=Flavobacterium sp. CYK-55 TaxID=2835529 RepID=UPI001BCE2AF0|nr:hypothetical protein [Flavobacterium sp. CYK-55]MBS7787606.1 hypothetical protein [Flavobacterium sp. CYK-55]
MKTCLECHERVIGREDKKFCSDSCRNSYNNRINKDTNNLMRNINHQLRKNYRLLSELKQKENDKVSRMRLVESGFDFNFFTGWRLSKKGPVFFVYDQGYVLLKNGWLKLVQKTQ